MESGCSRSTDEMESGCYRSTDRMESGWPTQGSAPCQQTGQTVDVSNGNLLPPGFGDIHIMCLFGLFGLFHPGH
eukprot:1142538-Pelagomonas_calceolata.AAC.3